MYSAVGTYRRRRPTVSSQVLRPTVIAGIRHADDLEGEAPVARDWRRKCERRSVVQDTGLQRHEEKMLAMTVPPGGLDACAGPCNGTVCRPIARHVLRSKFLDSR